MIRKSLICTFSLFVLYNLFLVYRPGLLAPQSTRQENAIKAEKYLYTDSSFENVIVGSSLADRLPADSLPGYYNLSFAGQSIFDGLAILSRQRRLPKRVFIETNMILKGENKTFTAPFVSPLSYYSHKHIRALQEGRQPLAVTSKILSGILSIGLGLVKTPALMHGTNADLQKILIEEQVKHLEETAQAFTPQSAEPYFSDLQYYVNWLRQHDVQTIFFEMPVNARIGNMRVPVFLRQKFRQVFPENIYGFIPQPDCSSYPTTDGLHLSSGEASLYVTYFKTAASRIAGTKLR